jgi:hypothetical protein
MAELMVHDRVTAATAMVHRRNQDTDIDRLERALLSAVP